MENSLESRMSLLDLRPSIPSILEEGAISSAERFQNSCLRPILKWQNDLLVRAMERHIRKRKQPWAEMKRGKRQAFIQQSLRKDLRFQEFMIGLIVGYFTLEEWEVYLEEEAELRRRIISMCIQRLEDQLLGG